MATAKPRVSRLEAWVTPEIKRLLEQAATLDGRTLSDFVASAAQAAAEEALRRHTVIDLSPSDSLKLALAVLDPAPPNEKLRDAFEAHRAQFPESKDW